MSRQDQSTATIGGTVTSPPAEILYEEYFLLADFSFSTILNSR